MKIDHRKLKDKERSLGCAFGNDGEFAEMILDISDYQEKTMPISNIEFRFFQGDIKEVRKAVALVDEDWIPYFNENTCVFCAYEREELASFCIVDVEAECILSTGNKKVGAIGCVGTVPQYRRLGIGLRMVDLATLYLKKERCDLVSISYTPVENWYKKLGYQTYIRFSFHSN